MEAVIGHLKSDHRMDRCRYKGFDGDKMNVSLAVMAWNTKKWVRKVREQRQKAAGFATHFSARTSVETLNWKEMATPFASLCPSQG